MPTTIATIQSESSITAAGDPVVVSDGYVIVENTARKMYFLAVYTAYDGNQYFEQGHFMGSFSFGVDDTVSQVQLWASISEAELGDPWHGTLPSAGSTQTVGYVQVTLDNQSSTVTITSDTVMTGPDGTHNVTNSSGRIIVSDPSYYAYFDGNTDQGVQADQTNNTLQVAPNGEPAHTQVRFSRTASSPDLTNAPVFLIRHTSHATVVLGFTDGVQHAFPSIVSPDSGGKVCVVNTASAELAQMSVGGAVNGQWSWTNFPAMLAPRGGTYIVDTNQLTGGQCVINWELTGDPRVVIMKSKLVGGANG